MPANLTPDYLAAEARFRSARANEEKLSALEAMLATIPKHKGTEKLQADIKRRISRLREKQPGKPNEFKLVLQGGALIAIIGLQSHMLIGPLIELPVNTLPYVGLIRHSGLDIQLAFFSSPTETFSDALSKADAFAVVLDLANDLLLDYFEEIRSQLHQLGISITRTSEPNQNISVSAKPALVIAVNQNAQYAPENLESLEDFCGDEFAVFTFSPGNSEELDELREALVDAVSPD